MLVSSASRRVAAILAAIVTAVALMAGPGLPDAHAQDRNLVIFGDSIVANPTVPAYLQAGLTDNNPGSSGNPQQGCAKGGNWGSRASFKMGLVPWDYSCSGTVSISQGPQFSGQVDKALWDNALTPNTARVVISTGFNDTYNNRNLSNEDLINRWVGSMAPQIQRIRNAAPNARIQIVGYPSITSGDSICLFHVGPNFSDRTFAPDVNHWQWQAQDMQIALARATGVEFLDTKPATAGNNMCAPDDQRMWAGLVDFYAGTGNLPIHVNDRGHEFVANLIANS